MVIRKRIRVLTPEENSYRKLGVFIISAPISEYDLPRIWYTNPFSNNHRIMNIRKLVKKKFITQWLLIKRIRVLTPRKIHTKIGADINKIGSEFSV